jgi:osmotically-inducible protein OsmY
MPLPDARMIGTFERTIASFSRSSYARGAVSIHRFPSSDTTHAKVTDMNLKPVSVLAFGALAVVASTLLDARLATAATQDKTVASNAATVHESKKMQRAADRELARRIHKQLVEAKGLQNTDITVFAMADSGKVILSGIIADASQDQLAADTASKVQGVTSVSSKLTIREQGS